MGPGLMTTTACHHLNTGHGPSGSHAFVVRGDLVHDTCPRHNTEHCSQQLEVTFCATLSIPRLHPTLSLCCCLSLPLRPPTCPFIFVQPTTCSPIIVVSLLTLTNYLYDLLESNQARGAVLTNVIATVFRHHRHPPPPPATSPPPPEDELRLGERASHGSQVQHLS